MGAFDYLTSSAVSLTVSGNTGISPFLTLLLLGIVEKSDPDLLNMDGFIEKVLSSWVGISVLAVLTGMEFLGKCIPVVDEIIDSIEVFVVPVLSIFGSLGTLGLLDLAQEATGERRLNVADSMLTFLKVVLVVIGVLLALAIHFFKMLIRLIGLTCCAGCCQPCITVVEVSCVLCGVLVAIFVRQIAIVTCIILFLAAGYAIKRKFIDKNIPEDGNNQNGTASAPAPAANGDATTPEKPANNSADVENPASQVEPVPPPTAPNLVKVNTGVSEAPPSVNPEFVKVEVDQGEDEDAVEVEAVAVR